MKALAAGEFFVNVGRAILLLCFAKYLYDSTGQLWAFSLIFVVEMLLAFVVPLLAGSGIDAKGAGTTIRWASAANLVICLFCVMAVTRLGVSVPLLIGSSMLLSAVNPVIKLSVFALTPELSSPAKLEKNNGFLAFAFQSGQLCGMAAAAVLLKFYQLLEVFAAVASVYAAALLFYFFASAKVGKEAAGAAVAQAVAVPRGELLRLCRRFGPTLLLSNFDFATVALFNVLLAALVAANYHNDPVWLSGLDAAFALGAIAGGFIIARQLRVKAAALGDAVLSQACITLCFVFYLIPPLKYLLPVAILAYGVLLSISMVFWNTHLQKHFPAEYKGRLAGVRNLVSSLYIGVATLTLSFFHQFGFAYAVAFAIVLSVVQLAGLLFYSQKRRAVAGGVKLSPSPMQ